MKKERNDKYRLIIIFLLVILFLPLLLVTALTIFTLPWNEIFSSKICTDTVCLEEFSKKYLGAFSWYASWLSVALNITTIIGVAIAALTYYKTQQSQAITNHFSNVDLFKNYVSEEVSKSEWLSIASFDLMVWYLKIYPDSKNGDMQCSQEYTNSINDLAKCIADSNLGVCDKKKIGYQFSKHQQSVKRIFRSLGISIKETNRLSFHEIEGELLDLINRVNKTFPNSQNFHKFPTRSYK